LPKVSHLAVGPLVLVPFSSCPSWTVAGIVSPSMNLLTTTVKDLNKILVLLERKEAIQSRIAAIDKELLAFDGEEPTPAAAAPPTAVKRGRKPGRKAVELKLVATPSAKPAQAASTPARKARFQKGRKPGELKAGILDLLQQAGTDGVTVQSIAGKLGTSPGNIRVWFSAHKQIKEIKKVAPGQYALGGAPPPWQDQFGKRPPPP